MNNNLTILENNRKLFYNNYDDPDYAKNYAEQLQVCLNDGLITVEDAKEEFENIQNKYPRLYHIRNFFAEALAPWIFDDIEIIEATVTEVEDYFHRNPDNESLAESYALSLWLLFEHPKARDRDSILESLSELINVFPDNETVADKYYQVLELYDVFQATVSATEQPFIDEESKECLDEENAIKYAESLFEASKSLEREADFNITISRFDSLYTQFPDNEEIKKFYVLMIYNATTLLEDDEIGDLIEVVSKIQSSSTSETIAETYALMLEDASSINWEIIERLKDLYEAFPSNNSIIDSYGFALSSFINDQYYSNEQRNNAKYLLIDLFESHPENQSLIDYIQ